MIFTFNTKAAAAEFDLAKRR